MGMKVQCLFLAGVLQYQQLLCVAADAPKEIGGEGMASIIQVAFVAGELEDRQMIAYVYKELPNNGIELFCIRNNEVVEVSTMDFSGGYSVFKEMISKSERECVDSGLKAESATPARTSRGLMKMSVIFGLGEGEDAEGQRFSVIEDEKAFGQKVLKQSPSLREAMKITNRHLSKGLRMFTIGDGPARQIQKKVEK